MQYQEIFCTSISLELECLLNFQARGSGITLFRWVVILVIRILWSNLERQGNRVINL